MHQCLLEKVVKKSPGYFVRTRQKMIAFVEGVTPNLKGKMIDLKKKDGIYFIEEVFEKSIDRNEINRRWDVGGL